MRTLNTSKKLYIILHWRGSSDKTKVYLEYDIIRIETKTYKCTKQEKKKPEVDVY